MKHNPKASPPNFEIVPGVLVHYQEDPDDPGYLLWADEEGCAYSDRDAEEVAAMLQAVYDKGRADASREDAGAVAEAIEAAMGEGYDKGRQDEMEEHDRQRGRD